MTWANAEGTVRDVLNAIQRECDQRGISVEVLSIGHDGETWVVEYGYGPRGFCIIRPLGLSEAAEAICRNVSSYMVCDAAKETARKEVPASRPPGAAPKGFSKRVRRRDGRCMVCGSTDRLHAHHIEPKYKAPERSGDPDNGITLCQKHHGETKEREADYADYFRSLLGVTS